MSALETKLLRDVKRAIFEFGMIEPWEILLIWVSWGKDSMLLWYLLSELRKTMKDKFEMRAVYIFKEFLIDCDIGFEEKRKFYEETLGIPLEKVNLKLPEDSELNNGVGQNCQWCAYSRRIAFMKLCQQFKATKIVLGHHMDDIVTTTFMNMVQGRNLKMMAPVNRMNAMKVAFIRPMAYLRESDIQRLVDQKWIPYSPCSCPVGNTTMRNKMKYELWDMEKRIPWLIDNTYWALHKDFVAKYKDKNYYID